MRFASIILLILSLISSVNGQIHDSLRIRNFSTGDYKAASTNFSGVMDENGILYFANENGILKYDGSDWEVLPIKNFSGTYSINISTDGRFYIGGNNEFGYMERDSANNFLYTSLRHIVPADHEFGTFWQTVSIGNDVYFSSYEGIVHYNGESGKHINIRNSSVYLVGNEVILSKLNEGIFRIKGDTTELLNDKFKWSNDNLYSVVHSIKDSTYLFFTSENGIYRYYPKEDSIIPLQTSDDEFFKKKQIYQAQAWRDSLYMISTWTGGMALMNEEGDIVSKIDKSAGLQTNSLRDFIIDKRGNVWTATTAGISYLQWEKDKLAAGYTPKTIITRANSRYDVDDILRSLEFHFATPGYDKADIQYAYYLEGYEEGFSPWSSDIKKEYTNLDGGNYRFLVKAKLPDDSETLVNNYSFSVPTPWYKNIWFIVFSIILIGSSIVLIYRYRTKRLKLLNKRLEKIINNRTQELIQQKEQLREANEELIVTNTELDNFVYRSSHDLVAPLKSLKGLINLAKLEAPDQRQTEYFSLMNNSVAKLEDFIKSIMEYSINSKRDLAKEEVIFDGIIDSICQDLQYYDNIERIEFIRNYDLDLVIKSDESRLKIVLSNLITNCIKYHNYNQEAPRIEVTVKQLEDENLSIIEVSDNGVGIDDEHLDKIFDMFFRATNDKAEGSGLGLYIVKDTVGKLGGQIAVKSTIGKGTTFTLKLYDTVIIKSLSSD